jgi:hypothetical protein
MRRPRAPEGLAGPGLALWRAVTGAYDLAPHEAELLRHACHVSDLIGEIDVALARDGLISEGQMGQPVRHPLLQASADQRRLLDALFRSMSLPMPDESTGRRRSPAAVAAAQARWRGQRGSA